MQTTQHLAATLVAATSPRYRPAPDTDRTRRPHRARAAALAAAPLLAAVALAGAPLVTGAPVAAPTRAHAAVAPSDQCNFAAAAFRSPKWPLCAGD